jgi:phosphomannomutase
MYYMSKNKIDLGEGLNLESLYQAVRIHFDGQDMNTIDGLKVELPEGWIHLRPSNTEPIVRIYAEAPSQNRADQLTEEVKALV